MFQITVDDGVKFYWDKKQTPIIDSWKEQSATPYPSKEITNLTPGSKIPFTIEYFQVKGIWQLTLAWSFDNGNTFSVIPASAFYKVEPPQNNLPFMFTSL
jgi:hypothetical protein